MIAKKGNYFLEYGWKWWLNLCYCYTNAILSYACNYNAIALTLPYSTLRFTPLALPYPFIISLDTKYWTNPLWTASNSFGDVLQLSHLKFSAHHHFFELLRPTSLQSWFVFHFDKCSWNHQTNRHFNEVFNLWCKTNTALLTSGIWLLTVLCGWQGMFKGGSELLLCWWRICLLHCHIHIH